MQRSLRKKKYSLEEVKTLFKAVGCILLSETYKNNNTALDYICSCGNKASIRLRSFLSGRLCRKCSSDRRVTTTIKNNGGVHHFSEKFFIEKRIAKCKEETGYDDYSRIPATKIKKKGTLKKKYGTTDLLNSDVFVMQRKNKMLKKFGVESYSQTIEYKEKLKKALLKKYGVPSLVYLCRSASKQSQKLFWRVYNLLPDRYQEKTYFAELNHEYTCHFDGQYYKYDFVITSLKIAIEFNGSRFHPKPNQSPEETNWCVFHPKLTVKEAREKENRKERALLERGYRISWVWDTELKNYQELVYRIMNWILLPELGRVLL